MDQALLLAGPGDAAANWVAARQHRLLTRGQASRAGLGRKAIEGRCSSDSWHRLYPRVFAIGPQAVSEYGRVLAVTLDAGAYAAATGSAAAFAYGLTNLVGPVIHVAMVGRRNCETRRGVCVHRPRGLTWNDVWFRHGIPVTSPIETMLALARELGSDELEAVCALAIRRGLISTGALRAAIAAADPRPGLPALRSAARDPSLTRSGNERRMLALIRRAELPEPRANVVVEGKELDLYWPDARLGVEVDAFSTHGSLAAFEDDRKVDADLEAADLRVVRFTRKRIRGRPEAVIARLAAILALRLGGLPAPRRR